MSQHAPAVQDRPAFIEAFLAQTRLAPWTRTATRPDPRPVNLRSGSLLIRGDGGAAAACRE